MAWFEMMYAPLSCSSLENRPFCKFGTAGYEIVYRFLVLLAYSAQWTSVIPHHSRLISLDSYIKGGSDPQL